MGRGIKLKCRVTQWQGGADKQTGDIMQQQNTQDWEPITLRGRPMKGKCVQARDCGAPERAHARKLEEADGPAKAKIVAADSKQELIRARLGRSLTQDKADAACALPKHTFRDIEAGKLTPTPAILRSISRELGVNLRLE